MKNIVLLLPLTIFAGSITKTFYFNRSEISITKIKGYDLISLADHTYTSEAGCPCLPEVNYSVLLPPTAEITSVEVLPCQASDLAGTFNILPAQKPMPLPLMNENGEITRPCLEIYDSSRPYPGKLVSVTPSGSMSGFRLGGLQLYPLQYLPAEKRLRFFTEITVRINYQEGYHEMIPLSRSQVDLFSQDVRNLVVNSEDIVRWAPSIKAIRDSTDYLIITGSRYVSALQPIAHWRTKKGYYTKIISTDSIYPRYPGRDNAEKVRNCIKDYWQNKGVKWVLLAGDISVVPHRNFYVNASGTIGNIPSDLYYADLQWSYDGNHNNIFGETPFNGDTVDLFYDVYLGRASIDTIDHANTFVLKDTIYEKRPEPDYMVRMLLPSANLWSGWPGDSTQNIIARMPPVPPWVIIKLYERLGNLTRSAVRETLRTGVGFVHFTGPGGEDSCIISSRDVYYLTNTDKYTVANATSSYAGAFDLGGFNNDCFAENFVNAPNGGAICAIFNSRYGWGYANGPAGPSEQFSMKFYEYFFNRDSLFEIGPLHAAFKYPFRNSAYGQAVWRWCYYELNLLGDPELPIWGLKPCTLRVSHPAAVPRGPQNYSVSVRTLMGKPLANALVCLWKGDEVYARGKTGASGSVTLAISPSTIGPMSVTATAKNHLPYESSCMVGIAEEERSDILSREIRIVSNPVTNRLIIHYSLPARERITTRAFDVSGREVAIITDREYSGTGEISWRPSNLAKGVYFIQIQAGHERRTEKIVFPQ